MPGLTVGWAFWLQYSSASFWTPLPSKSFPLSPLSYLSKKIIVLNLFQSQNCREKGSPITGSFSIWLHWLVLGQAKPRGGSLSRSPTWLAGAQAFVPTSACCTSSQVSLLRLYIFLLRLCEWFGLTAVNEVQQCWMGELGAIIKIWIHLSISQVRKARIRKWGNLLIAHSCVDSMGCWTPQGQVQQAIVFHLCPFSIFFFKLSRRFFSFLLISKS